MSAPLAAELHRARLAAERAVLRRLNAGYGFAHSPLILETFFQDRELRERVGGDLLRPQATHLEQLATVEEELAALGEASASAVATLSTRLRLGALERDVLALAVAVALDSDTRALCSSLSNPSRAALTAASCQEIFPASCGDRQALSAALHSAAPLCRYRALTVGDAAGLEASIAAGPDLLAAIRGDTRVPERLATVVEVVSQREPRYLPTSISERIAVLAEVIGSAEEAPAVIAAGPQGSGKRAIAAELAGALSRRLVALSVTALGSRDQLIDVLAYARLHDRLVYVAGVETIEDPAVNRVLDEHDDLLILGTRETGAASIRLSRPSHRISSPRPTLETRAEVWRAALADNTTIPSVEAESLAARYVIGAGAIGEVLVDARRYAASVREAITASHVEEAVSRRLSLNLGVLGERITRRASFDEMVLPDDVVETLRDLTAMVKGRSQILETWGYERHLGLSRGVSALFSGAPGTGKTMAASVVSSELGLELFRIDLSSVVSKWVGETEKNLAKIFDEAQDAHAMLLFDEADSLFGKRTDVQNASDRYANLEVNYVLQRMEQFDGISILTTNLESGIDPAFMRRLNFRVRFPEPEVEERATLWRKLLPPDAGLGDVAVDDLAEKFEMTGGHIRNAIVRAAVIASRQGRAMRKDDLLAGADHEYFELGKVMHSSL